MSGYSPLSAGTRHQLILCHDLRVNSYLRRAAKEPKVAVKECRRLSLSDLSDLWDPHVHHEKSRPRILVTLIVRVWRSRNWGVRGCGTCFTNSGSHRTKLLGSNRTGIRKYPVVQFEQQDLWKSKQIAKPSYVKIYGSSAIIMQSLYSISYPVLIVYSQKVFYEFSFVKLTYKGNQCYFNSKSFIT